MPRATHPITGVLHYFRTAPLDAAEVAVQLVRDIVKERQPKVGKPREKKAAPPKAKERTATPPPPTPPAPRVAKRPGLPQPAVETGVLVGTQG